MPLDQNVVQTSVTDQYFSYAQASLKDPSLAGTFSCPLEQDVFDFPDQQLSGTKLSNVLSDFEEGEVCSDMLDNPNRQKT